jgi:hypothetical protein
MADHPRSERESDTLKLIEWYLDRFVGSTAEQIVMQRCYGEILSLRKRCEELERQLNERDNRTNTNT